jgi:UDP-N-acetylmuramate dehydrogenase
MKELIKALGLNKSGGPFMKDIIAALQEGCGTESVLLNEPMQYHTSFKTGGEADIFITPKSIEALTNAIRILRQANTPYYILGNGSNVLVSDKGIRGTVIQIGRNMSEITVNENQIKVQAGALLSSVAVTAFEHGLGGMEFASGIPGSFGGAVCMNAGAYDGEMKDILSQVQVLTPELELITLSSQELELGYRHSIIPEKSYLVVSGILTLQKGDKRQIQEKMASLAQQRREKQPLNYPSAGSTFKRPEGYFAGKLIEDAGLKGYSIGGAQVSEKHAGFIINKGNATTQDILDLIAHCQKTVQEKFGVLLETEVKIIGE